jgi:Tfp pilus assembly protein PilV
MTRLRLSDDRGFAMVEAIVASMLLVMVALGVLKGLDTAQQSSGREKARSTAAALTEQDQERLRSFRAVDLANYDETRTIKVNNVDYTVQSQVDWIRDSTGGTQSCNNSATQADYMRITTTTTSNLVNTPIAPITQSSLVAPPVGAFGTNQGTLGIQVNNRDGVGVEDINVTIAGPTTVTNPTNSAGCAIFAYVPTGAYTASVNTPGWVDKGGNQSTSVGATVSNGTVNVKNLDYDQAASVDGIFDTETLGGATVPATTTQLSAANPGVSTGPFAPFAGERVWDPTGGALATISATGLYPFSDGYNLYAGGCPGADPTKNDPDYFTTLGAGSVVAVDPGAASPAVKVRVPSIDLRVLYNGAPLAATYVATTRIVATQTSPGCTTNPEKFTFGAPSTDANGWMLTPALPFGSYSVCVESKTPATPTTPRKKSMTVNNYYHRGVKPVADPSAPVSPVIDLNTSGYTSGTC